MEFDQNREDYSVDMTKVASALHASIAKMKEVTIYSDGACKGNPGPGGWACVLIYGSVVKELSGSEPATTNNRMELRAAIEGLGALTMPCKVQFHTDSKYLCNGVSRWLEQWRRCGWVTKGKKPVKNLDLWKALDTVQLSHSVMWHWVKGHRDDLHNRRCDRLAKCEIANLNRNHTETQLKTKMADFLSRHWSSCALG